MRQADVLRAATDSPAPPVLKSVLAMLPEIEVRGWRWLPHPVLLLPSGRRWLILLDPDQDQRDQNLHVMHQIKHVLDAPDRPPGSCENEPSRALDCHHFAMNVLAPAILLRHDVASGIHEVAALSRRYGAPVPAMQQRLSELGLDRERNQKGAVA